MTGNLLVQNAMMVLPDGIVEGDLRVANGRIKTCLLYTSDAADE